MWYSFTIVSMPVFFYRRSDKKLNYAFLCVQMYIPDRYWYFWFLLARKSLIKLFLTGNTVPFCGLTNLKFPSPACTANDGSVRMQYKCLVPIYVFPEMKLREASLFPKQNYNVLSPYFQLQESVGVEPVHIRELPGYSCIKQRLFLALHFIHIYFSALFPLYYIL
jgi:hypothetical protein